MGMICSVIANYHELYSTTYERIPYFMKSIVSLKFSIGFLTDKVQVINLKVKENEHLVFYNK